MPSPAAESELARLENTSARATALPRQEMPRPATTRLPQSARQAESMNNPTPIILPQPSRQRRKAYFPLSSGTTPCLLLPAPSRQRADCSAVCRTHRSHGFSALPERNGRTKIQAVPVCSDSADIHALRFIDSAAKARTRNA